MLLELGENWSHEGGVSSWELSSWRAVDTTGDRLPKQRKSKAFSPANQSSLLLFHIGQAQLDARWPWRLVMAVCKFPRHRMGQRDWIWGLGWAKEEPIHLNLPTEQLIFMSHQHHPTPFHL